MSQLIGDSRTISLKLSEVLGDIGLNEKMVMKRRRIFQLMETIDNTTHTLLGEEEYVTFYNFGSQIEGSTTMELDSDIDTLMSLRYRNVRAFKGMNLKMVQDEFSSPGYCLIKLLQPEMPLIDYISIMLSGAVGRDRKGRLVLKNSCCDDFMLASQFRNGPANTFIEKPSQNAEDNVIAFRSKSWPVKARSWLTRKGKSGWPTEDMKRKCETTGCFLVPVGSKSGQNSDIEWRISTSLAERHLMFDLNITQMRCYALMKMILKRFISPQCDDVLSSFMCKTVLFFCIEETQSNEWKEHNLLACLTLCLLKLHDCITRENCPHFIIPENNLLTGKLTPPIKRRLLETLEEIIQSEGAALLKISIDDLGARLKENMSMLPAHPLHQHYKSPADVHAEISGKLLKHIARQLAIRHKFYLTQVMYDEKQIVKSRSLVCMLTEKYSRNSISSLEKAAYKFIIPLLSSSLASAIASCDLRANKTISQEAEDLFSEGLHSDISSGRLKFASALYCAGEFERAELLLRNTESMYDQDCVETVCTCRDGRALVFRLDFVNRSNTGNEELIKHIIAFCVRFIPCEEKCVPKEMQYEMFRSTKEEMLKRNKLSDSWMDWSVVDSLPYLYFLQYKTYDQLERTADKIMALENLNKCTLRGLNIMHTETALNLLGQCFEQENQFARAFDCYARSLNKRKGNNVAKIHICRLLNVMVNRNAVQS